MTEWKDKQEHTIAVVPTSSELALIKADKYNLPVQVIDHFKDADDEQLASLALMYDGPKVKPSFEEWIECYQASTLFKTVNRGDQWVQGLKKLLEDTVKEFTTKRQEGRLTEDEDKYYNKEIFRLNKMIGNIGDQYLNFSRELNKLVQNKLNREAPKKLEVTQHKVTPSDVANLIYQARKTVVDVKAK